MIVDITINGPNGMLSFTFFFLKISNIMLMNAPIKNDVTAIISILGNPITNPSAAISFTSPKPIASLLVINLPINVIIPKIAPPTTNPMKLLTTILKSIYPNIIVKIIPISKTVNANLLGILLSL